MYILYESLGTLSRTFSGLVARLTQTNSGGPHTTSACQVLFSSIYQNLRKLSHDNPA